MEDPVLTQSQIIAHLGRIYDRLKSACLNKKYYGEKLYRYQQIDLWSTIVMAVGTSAAIGAWSIWHQPGGRNFWTILASVATLASLIKPFFGFPKKIERLTRLQSGYMRLYHDLYKLVEDIRSSECVTKKMLDMFDAADTRYREFAVDDDLKKSKRLANRCEEEVRREFPNTFFWNPLLKTARLKETKRDGLPK